MIDDAPKLDQPEANRLYRSYLATCRRLGATTVSRERAEKLIAAWAAIVAASLPVPPITH